MKIQIEDYYGNDILRLDFRLLNSTSDAMEQRIQDIHHVALNYKYSLADVDDDEEDEGEYIRLQQIEDIQNKKSQKELIGLISELTKKYVGYEYI